MLEELTAVGASPAGWARASCCRLRLRHRCQAHGGWSMRGAGRARSPANSATLGTTTCHGAGVRRYFAAEREPGRTRSARPMARAAMPAPVAAMAITIAMPISSAFSSSVANSFTNGGARRRSCGRRRRASAAPAARSGDEFSNSEQRERDDQTAHSGDEQRDGRPACFMCGAAARRTELSASATVVTAPERPSGGARRLR